MSINYRVKLTAMSSPAENILDSTAQRLYRISNVLDSVCVCGLDEMVPYCFPLAGCQNPPLPVVDPGGLSAAVGRKHLTSSRTEHGCAFILWILCMNIF